MAEALISVLLEQLASVVFEHTRQAVTLVLNAKEDVHSFSSNLKAIQAVLEDAEKKQVTEAKVRDWLQKLKDVSYEMDDVLDEWNTEILKQQVEEGENAFVTKKKFLGQKECIIIEAVQGNNQKMELPGNEVRHLTLTSLPKGPLSFDNCKTTMRTLTLLGSSITNISSGSIMQMKCVRTLNLSHNKLNEVPKEIGELIHLRYMDLSYSGNLKELPDAVCDLYNLQTLVLVGCRELEKLPKAMGKLINLKHLYVEGSYGLRYLPKGIGSLKSLQVLDWFYLCEGDDEALKLGDLGIMDQLQGSLSIDRLWEADASEIEKAKLGNKEHLSHLEVYFVEEEDEEQRKGDEDIVKALQPHQNLESLWIGFCHGTTESLYWIKSLQYLRRVSLQNWRFCEVLPPLGKLPSLEILEFEWMEEVKKVGVEFLGIEEEEEEQVSGILFPKLKQLYFQSMKNWVEWAFLSEITIMPRLSSLRIRECRKLKALPEFLYKITTLRTLEIDDCPILEGEYEKGVGKEWHNISHIPNLTIRSKWRYFQAVANHKVNQLD